MIDFYKTAGITKYFSVLLSGAGFSFGSPEGEPSTTRSMPQQMCEKLWTLPVRLARLMHYATEQGGQDNVSTGFS
jgi:hypothetical protein